MAYIKNLIGRIPPIEKALSERNLLRVEKARLSLTIDALKRQIERLRAELKVRAKETAGTKIYHAAGHFYSPIPSLDQLRDRAEVIFDRTDALLPGIELNSSGQLELLKTLSTYYRDLPFGETSGSERRFRFANPNFTYADAIFYYGLIRHLQPKRIVEVGSGFSSCLALDTNELHRDNAIECTFIEPFPQLLGSLLRADDRRRIAIVQDYVQEVPLTTFTSLEANDILFIDSSHVSKVDSDLNHILFSILPVLQSGVYVHFHDIFYPFEYPKEWVFQGRAFNECYLLRAFLSHNSDYTIELFSSYLIAEHKEILAEQMPLCLGNEGGSLWLRKRGGRTVPLSGMDAADKHRLTPALRRKTPSSSTTVDVTDLIHPRQLGAGWYECDSNLARRWMTNSAEIRIAGPKRPGQRLWLEALQPNPEGVTINVIANECDLGRRDIGRSEFRESFDLPDALVGSEEMLVTIRLDKTWNAPGDPRKLGLRFGRLLVD